MNNRASFISIFFLITLFFFPLNLLAQSYGHGSCSEVDENALVRTYNMAISCGVFEPEQDTFVLVDTTNSVFNTATQNPDKFTHPDWTAEQIGIVFASEYDLQGNIYVAASRNFAGTVGLSSSLHSLHQYGLLGGTNASGAIYKLDAITGTPSVWRTLPQNTSIPIGQRLGLGGITYDRVTNSMYVVNRFDNTIYHLDGTTGVTISTYTPDPILIGGVSNGEQAVPFGLDIFNGRLYYTVQNAETNPNVNSGSNNRFVGGIPTVRSLSINANGSLSSASDILEVREVLNLAIQPGDGFFTLSGDIDFSQDGEMSLGTYSAGSLNCPSDSTIPYWACMYNHEAYVLTLTGASGSWSIDTFTPVAQEQFNGANYTSTGSVAFNPFPYNEDILWMTGGDFRDQGSNWGIIGYDVNTLTSALNVLETSSSYIQFLYEIPDASNSTDPKGLGGEVDIFACVTVNIGNYIFLDTNENGIQDSGDTPIVGATVNLYDKNTGALLDTVLTAPSGEYLFINVPPSTDVKIALDLPADYAVGGALEGLSITLLDIGSNDTLDSDAMVINGSPSIMLTTPDFVEATTTQDLSFDIGLVESVRIGDLVWFDTDRDGVQDTGEFAIAGVTVNLYDKTTGSLIGTTLTDTNGNYFFDIPAGLMFTIKLDNPTDYAVGGVLEGLIPTNADLGGDDANDSDAMDMDGFGAIMSTSPEVGEDLTFDFGFIGGNLVLHDGATQRFLDNAALVLSRLNARLGRALLRSSNRCSALSKNKIRKMSDTSNRLYGEVWTDIWWNLKFGSESNCIGTYDNSIVKDRILSTIAKLNKINLRLTNCMLETGKVRAGNKIRKRFKKKLRQFNKELKTKESIPDQVLCSIF